jgi:hypothetical protein
MQNLAIMNNYEVTLILLVNPSRAQTRQIDFWRVFLFCAALVCTFAVMIAAIITTPTRQMYLTDLVKVVSPYVSELHIFNDLDRKGHWFNLERAIAFVTDKTKKNEWGLVMCDDVITIDSWMEHVDKIKHETKADFITLACSRKHVFTEQSLKKGFNEGVFPRCFYDHAFMIKNNNHFVQSAIKWAETINWKPKGRGLHLDVVLQEYLIAHNKKWAIATPSIFKHVGIVSECNHKIAETVAYIGNLKVGHVV